MLHAAVVAQLQAHDRRGRAGAGHAPQRAHVVRQARRFAHAVARGVPGSGSAGPGRACCPIAAPSCCSCRPRTSPRPSRSISGLEAMSAASSPARASTDAEVNEIRALHFEMLACHAVRDLPGYYRLNYLIHDAINKAARNDVLRQTYTHDQQPPAGAALPVEPRPRQMGCRGARAFRDDRGAGRARRRAALSRILRGHVLTKCASRAGRSRRSLPGAEAAGHRRADRAPSWYTEASLRHAQPGIPRSFGTKSDRVALATAAGNSLNYVLYTKIGHGSGCGCSKRVRMFQLDSHPSGRHFLQIPGPDQRAGSRAARDGPPDDRPSRAPSSRRSTLEILEGLKQVFQTDGPGGHLPGVGHRRVGSRAGQHAVARRSRADGRDRPLRDAVAGHGREARSRRRVRARRLAQRRRPGGRRGQARRGSRARVQGGAASSTTRRRRA